MGSGKEILNVIDEQGNIIGEATREEIHKRGLLHREIHVWIYTPKKEIIFQKRSPNKDTFPNLLDASVGGHVDLGDSFEAAAVRELEEETGIKVKKEDLKLYKMKRSDRKDPVTQSHNNALRALYIYKFAGGTSGLKTEARDGAGFEFWPISRLKNLSPTEAARFIPEIIEGYLPMFEKICATE
jgi:isopentenyldiphosphate isomerase